MFGDRWGQTAETAAALTGAALVDVDLERAEDEIRDVLGWEPRPETWTVAGVVGPAGLAFGRAIAWQAAWRKAHPADAGDVDAGKTSESFPDYSYSRERPIAAAGLRLSDRALAILERWGFRRMTGASRTAPAEVPDTWRPL